jgi:hypothetical protein
LRSDGYYLKDWRDQQTQENVERKKFAQRHRVGQHLVRADFHNERAHHSHQSGSGKTH